VTGGTYQCKKLIQRYRVVVSQALRLLHDYDMALIKIRKAAHLQPCDKDIAKEMRKLEE